MSSHNRTHNRPKIGTLVIGQTPRPDLVDPVAQQLPNCDLIQLGALDCVAKRDLPPIVGDYPLVTRMASGALVMVEEAFLVPRLQACVRELEAQGVAAAILLCAGTFADVHSDQIPLVKPFAAGQAWLRRHGMLSVGFIAPVVEQERPIYERWVATGIRPNVWTATLNQQDAAFQAQLNQQIAAHALEAIVLDYVGHLAEQVAQLQQHSPVPVVDLGQLALQQLTQPIE